ncbi:MAG: sigma-54-dependent Fis family transcriptional regulator [Myxococcales bacterium]|nr:sigma-54-dependent Fis family transcriptional regulator [Myxococcales bacterium]MCB9648345.1 sigma-54-dependent Fis family transcriptional regulator [Deltaproteobacteria bacterium]
MHALFARIEEVAKSDTSVVIQGETGTGKELVAEVLHDLSPRSPKPYVVVDCAAVPRELIESEIFGHAKGSFTGAMSDRQGAFEAASGGTIFIDEIGELPMDLQPRLLRVLEKQEIKRVGAEATRKIDVRVVTATNRDLAREVAEGRFREDLFFRLNVVKLALPPLRERPEDIIFLAERFLADFSGLDPIELKDDTKEKLLAHPWPGNIRELRNLIDRGAAMSDRWFRLPEDFGRTLDIDGADGLAPGSGVGLYDEYDAPPPPAQDPLNPRQTVEPSAPDVGVVTRPLWHGRSYKDAKDAVMADFEQGYIKALLAAHGGNVSAAARAAGIHRNILHRMMARYGLER